MLSVASSHRFPHHLRSIHLSHLVSEAAEAAQRMATQGFHVSFSSHL